MLTGTARVAITSVTLIEWMCDVAGVILSGLSHPDMQDETGWATYYTSSGVHKERTALHDLNVQVTIGLSIQVQYLWLANTALQQAPRGLSATHMMSVRHPPGPVTVTCVLSCSCQITC